MAELDIETLKRLEKSDDCVEIAAEVQPMLSAILAALEDRDRLRAAADRAAAYCARATACGAVLRVALEGRDG